MPAKNDIGLVALVATSMLHKDDEILPRFALVFTTRHVGLHISQPEVLGLSIFYSEVVRARNSSNM